MAEQPTTAWDLLEQVAQHIVAEPLRYNQGLWGNVDTAAIRDLQGGVARNLKGV